MSTLYKALIFDMDGTLFDTEPLHRNAWREVFQQYKIELLDDEIIQFNGSSPENVATKIIQMNNLNVNPLHIAAQKKKVVERMFNNEPINILPAALLLKQFHADYAIGLGTGSGASTAITLLNRFNFLEFFNTIVSADDVTHHKPQPDTFLKCAKRLGVEPAQCLVFEDSHFGILAGENAGMSVVNVNGKKIDDLYPLLLCAD